MYQRSRLWIVALGLWLIGITVVCAQRPADAPPITIVKSASPDPVLAGEELTYRMTITSTSDSPLLGVVVTDVVPLHTTFMLASGRGGDWWMQTPRPGEQGEIVWRHDGPLSPEQASHLRFVVRTETSNAEPIVSQGFRVTFEGWYAMVSQPVTTQVLLPTPPPTSVPSAATSTPSSTPAPPTARPSPTWTPSQDTAPQSSSRPFSGLAGLLIGLVIVSAASMTLLVRLVKNWRITR